MLGYAPQDNTEAYAAEVQDIQPPQGSNAERFQGGIFTEPEYRGRANEPT